MEAQADELKKDPRQRLLDRVVWMPLQRAALSRWGRRLVPRRLRHALVSFAGLNEIRALDAGRNREGRLPDGEEISVEAIWISEAYPPSYLDGLIDGLDALRVGGHSGSRETAAHYVRLYRSGAHAGGSVNLGFFTRRGQGVFGADYVETDLPPRVGRASGWLENVTPSLSVVTIQFEVAVGDRALLDRPLRTEYQTRLRRFRHGWLYVNPDNQRKEAMQAAISELTHECASWVRRHFPGAFAAGLQDGDYPSCVFLTTRQVVPFARPAQFTEWLWTAGLDASHEAWNSEDWPGLYLRVPERDGERLQWWLAGRQGDFLSDARDKLQAAYGGATRAGWLNRVHDEMSMTLMLHATESLLTGMHAAVSRSRDSMGATATPEWDIRRLDALRTDVTAFVRDVEPVASDLSSKHWRTHERATFRPGPEHILTLIRQDPPGSGGVPQEARPSIGQRARSLLRRPRPVPTIGPPKAEPSPTLTKHQADSIRHRAELLLDAERQHRDALATVSTLLAASEAVRLDRRVLVLTLVFGAIAVIAAMPSIAEVVRFVIQSLGL